MLQRLLLTSLFFMSVAHASADEPSYLHNLDKSVVVLENGGKKISSIEYILLPLPDGPTAQITPGFFEVTEHFDADQFANFPWRTIAVRQLCITDKAWLKTELISRIVDFKSKSKGKILLLQNIRDTGSREIAANLKIKNMKENKLVADELALTTFEDSNAAEKILSAIRDNRSQSEGYAACRRELLDRLSRGSAKIIFAQSVINAKGLTVSDQAWPVMDANDPSWKGLATRGLGTIPVVGELVNGALLFRDVGITGYNVSNYQTRSPVQVLHNDGIIPIAISPGDIAKSKDGKVRRRLINATDLEQTLSN